jgi:hypothetical protein
MKPTHDPDDDAAARQFIDNLLRRSDDDAWKSLLSDTYARQTQRVLKTIEDAAISSRTHRNEEISALRQKFLAGEIDQQRWDTLADEFSEWRKRVTHFEALVRERRRQAADRADKLRGYALAREVTSTLVALAKAVDEHRRATEDAGIEPESHDRLLWLRLQTLAVPVEEGLRKINLQDFITHRPSSRGSEKTADRSRRRTGRRTP